MPEDSIRLGIIKHISQEHIRSAIHLAKLAYQVELDFTSQNREKIPFYSHRAYITGSIMLCVAFIEARINELIIGGTINVNPWNEGAIDNNLFKSFQELGKLEGIRNLRTLEKYQLALSIFGNNPFVTGATPYQDVELLIALRNKLTHFKPEVQWLDDEHHFFQRFKSRKLPINPIAPDPQRLDFPDALLGYECAKWAIKSSIRFVSEFDSRLKLTAINKSLEDELP